MVKDLLARVRSNIAWELAGGWTAVRVHAFIVAACMETLKADIGT